MVPPGGESGAIATRASYSRTTKFARRRTSAASSVRGHRCPHRRTISPKSYSLSTTGAVPDIHGDTVTHDPLARRHSLATHRQHGLGGASARINTVARDPCNESNSVQVRLRVREKHMKTPIKTLLPALMLQAAKKWHLWFRSEDAGQPLSPRIDGSPSALKCQVSYNQYGGYCVPLSSRHRPAAKKSCPTMSMNRKQLNS